MTWSRPHIRPIRTHGSCHQQTQGWLKGQPSFFVHRSFGITTIYRTPLCQLAYEISLNIGSLECMICLVTSQTNDGAVPDDLHSAVSLYSGVANRYGNSITIQTLSAMQNMSLTTCKRVSLSHTLVANSCLNIKHHLLPDAHYIERVECQIKACSANCFIHGPLLCLPSAFREGMLFGSRIWSCSDRMCSVDGAWGLHCAHQSGRSPKVVALFSATNLSSYIIELLQLHDTIQIKCNYAWIHYNIAIKRHLMM